jgi:hypothetical protein
MFQRITTKPMHLLIVLSVGLTMIGCNQAENRSAVIPSNQSSNQSSNAQPTTKESTAAPVTAASDRETTVPTAQSSQPSTTNIPAGRYWIGSTDQALDVEGERYRYLDAESEQPWRSNSELQLIKSGVIYDGQNYWCLSTMAPKDGGAIACSKDGWNQTVSQAAPAKDASTKNETIFLCHTTDGNHIELADLGETIMYSFGEPGVSPEITLKVPRSAVENYQWSGVSRSMNYSVTVPNGNVGYRVFWSLDKLYPNQKPESGVEVVENGKLLTTVNCAGEMVNRLKGFSL